MRTFLFYLFSALSIACIGCLYFVNIVAWGCLLISLAVLFSFGAIVIYFKIPLK